MIHLKENDKTHMFIIPKIDLMFVTKESIMRALESLQENLHNELRKQYLLRQRIAHKKENVDPQIVKNDGFLSQHYLNSLFAIEMLNPKEERKEQKIEIVEDNNVCAIMEKIGEYSDPCKIDLLRKKLLYFKSDLDRKIIFVYLKFGNFHQRKSARYYLYSYNN